MVKLLRLQGDSDRSSTEIRNIFKTPIEVQPNAKVALVGVSAVLTDEVLNESFVIDEQSRYFKIGDVNATYQAALTAGQYSAHTLVDEFSTAANYAATDVSARYLHHVASVADGKFKLETHQAPFSNAGFDDEFLWEAYSGSAATATSTSLVAGASGLQYGTYAGPTSAVPMFHNSFAGIIVSATGGLEIYASDGIANPVFGLKIDASLNYLAIFRPSKAASAQYVDLSYDFNANDVFSFDTYGGNLQIKITDASGTVRVNYTRANAVDKAYYKPSSETLDWWIRLSANNSLSNMVNSTLINLFNQSVCDVSTQGVLQFINASGVSNTLLATYFGLGRSVNAPINYTGNPATLVGREEMVGLAAYPGILIQIDGLGKLSSYDGSPQSKGQDNIVYVVNDLSVVSGNQIQLDVPAPFFLDIKNSHPITVTELRARFLPVSGGVSNTNISFSGKPSLTLLIDG